MVQARPPGLESTTRFHKILLILKRIQQCLSSSLSLRLYTMGVWWNNDKFAYHPTLGEDGEIQEEGEVEGDAAEEVGGGAAPGGDGLGPPVYMAGEGENESEVVAQEEQEAVEDLGDAELNLDELAEALGTSDVIQQVFDAIDTNSDGFVNRMDVEQYAAMLGAAGTPGCEHFLAQALDDLYVDKAAGPLQLGAEVRAVVRVEHIRLTPPPRVESTLGVSSTP